MISYPTERIISNTSKWIAKFTCYNGKLNTNYDILLLRLMTYILRDI